MEIKQVGQATIDFVHKKYWDPQLRNPLHCPYAIFAVHQIKAHKALLEEFEEKRTELTRRVPKVKVLWGYYGAPLTKINEVLSYGWYRALNGAPVTVFTDPSEAIPLATDKVLVLCRMALGNGSDYQFNSATTKYIFPDGRQIMPSWLVTFAADSSSYRPQKIEIVNVGEQNITLNSPKKQATTTTSTTQSRQAQDDDDEIQIEVDVDI